MNGAWSALVGALTALLFTTSRAWTVQLRQRPSARPRSTAVRVLRMAAVALGLSAFARANAGLFLAAVAGFAAAHLMTAAALRKFL